MLYQLVDYGHHRVSEREMLEITERIIPLLETTQDYVWRRHLAAALAADERFRLRSRKPLAVRGYRHLQQRELRRSD